MRTPLVFILISMLALPAIALLQGGLGYNIPTGSFKSDTNFPGGMSFSLGAEMPILFLGFGAEGRYHILGDTVGDVEVPEIPGQTFTNVTVKSYLIGGQAYVRIYPVQSSAINIFGEGGIGYYHRGFQIQNLPIPTDLGAQDGLGYSFGLGAKLIPISPIKPMIVFRYEIGHDVGRSDIDALINPDSNEKKDATLFSIIAGVDLL
jgi:hypothetical protein